MKQLKVTFLFFGIIASLILVSCIEKHPTKSNKNYSNDSINVLIENMRNSTFKLNDRLYYGNKALKIANEIKDEKKSIEILSFQGYLYGLLKEYDKAIDISKLLMSKSTQVKDSASIADHSFRIGYHYLMQPKKDSAFIYFLNAKNIYKGVNDSLKTGQSLAQMAMIQSDYGYHSESDKNAIQALNYIKDKDDLYTSSIYNCIAISSKNQEDYKEAIYWYNKALDLPSTRLSKIRYLNNKANAYRNLKEHTKSIEILEELLKDSIVNSRLILKARVIDNLAFAKWSLNKGTNVYSELIDALSIRIAKNDQFGVIASYSHLSNYFKFKNTNTAYNYALKMYETALLEKTPHDKIEALKIIIDLGNSKNIKKYYSAYVHLNDSLTKAQNSTKNQFAKLIFDSDKNREVNLTLSIANAKKEVELEKEKSQNIIGAISSGTILLGLIGFGFYRKQKHKQEKREEVYKTETRIAKKVHDEVANNVVNIMNKVQYTEVAKDDILDELEKVYLLTRDISHQNSTIETGDKFEPSLKNLLASFNTETTKVILKNFHNVGLNTFTKNSQIEIYRVLQELMVNMQKHSKATLVAISFKNNKDQYSLNYSDNGVGLEFNALSMKNGLKNVETRIKSLNGIINFESSLNNGFKVFISFKE